MRQKDELDRLVNLISVKVDDVGEVENIFNDIYKALDVLDIIKRRKVVINWDDNSIFTYDKHFICGEEIMIRRWVDDE